MNEIFLNEDDAESSKNSSKYVGDYWLKAGIYVRSKTDYDNNIKRGAVLLITDIERVDGKDHTVNILAHPEWETRRTYSFVANEFMQLFSYAADGEKVRAIELQKIQGKITDKTNEMNQGPTDLEIKLHFNESKRLEQQGEDETEASTEITFNTSLASMENPEKALLLRDSLDSECALAHFTKDWLQERVTDIQNTCSVMARFAAEKAKVAIGSVQNSLELADKLNEGLKTLTLYTGEGVDLFEICTGESAPPEEKLYLYQNKLWMDEESIAHTAMGGLDCRHFNVFLEQLKTDKSLRDRLIPTARGVALLGYSRSHRKEYDSLDSSSLNKLLKENRQSFLIIKNGENLTALTAPIAVENASQLFPTVNDYDKPFKGLNGENITIHDIAYSRKYAEYERQVLHYKRLLILLWGLHDRLHLFGKEWGSASDHFTSEIFQSSYFEFLYDGSFVIEENMPSYYDFISQHSSVQSGSSIICYWRELIESETAPSCFHGLRSYNMDAYQEYYPENETDICIVQKANNEHFVKVEVSNYGRSFNAKVAINKTCSGFICLDDLKSSDLDYYINSRKERRNYLHYIPLFTKIKNHLSKLDKMWSPIKERVLATLKLHSEEAEETLSQQFELLKKNFMIQNPKIFTKYLTKTKEDFIFNEIVEIFKKQAKISDEFHFKLECKILKENLSPVLLTYSGKGRIELIAEIQEPILNIFPEQSIWVAKYIVTEKARSVTMSKPSYIDFNERKKGVEVLKTWDTAKSYSSGTNHLKLKFKKEQEFFNQLTQWECLFKAPEDWEEEFKHCKKITGELSKKYVNIPSKAVPVGVVLSPFSGGKKGIIRLQVDALEWLYYFSSIDQKDMIKNYVNGLYQSSQTAHGVIAKLNQIESIYDCLILLTSEFSFQGDFDNNYHEWNGSSRDPFSWPIKYVAIQKYTSFRNNFKEYFSSAVIPDEERINTHFRKFCPEKMVDSDEWEAFY